MDHPYFPVEP